MVNNETLIPIPGRLHSVAVGEPVSGADDVLDDALNMEQSKINQLTVGTKNASTGTTGDYPYNGMGRVVLPKNMVNGVNTLTQDMLYKGDPSSRVPNTNTIFVIQYDYVLGENITVPANCVLEFDGGSLSNGTLIGNNTSINTSINKIFSNILLQGTFKMSYIDSNMFAEYNEQTLLNIMHLASGECFTYVNIQKESINIKGYIDENIDGPVGNDRDIDYRNAICVPSNTEINFNDGELNIIPNHRNNYAGLSLCDVTNVTIRNLTINGDADTHTEGEWGHGFSINGCENIIIDNCKCIKCSGDAISIGFYYPYVGQYNVIKLPDNFIISNSYFDSCRRQGISITAGFNIEVKNTTIVNIGKINGTLPMAGIDIEPNNWPTEISAVGGIAVKNTNIHDCVFDNTERENILIYSPQSQDDETAWVQDIKIENSIFGNHIKVAANCNVVSIVNNVFNGKYPIILVCKSYTIFKNNTVNGGSIWIEYKGAVNALIENNTIKPLQSVTGSGTFMGINIANLANCDYSNVIIKDNYFYYDNPQGFTGFGGIRPINRSTSGLWTTFVIKKLPVLINNIFEVNNHDVVLSGNKGFELYACRMEGNTFIARSNKVESIGKIKLMLVKTDETVIDIRNNEFYGLLQVLVQQGSEGTQQYTANDYVLLEGNIIHTNVNNIPNCDASSVFIGEPTTSPVIIERNNVFNSVSLDTRVIPTGWTINKNGTFGAQSFADINGTKKPIYWTGSTWVDATGATV